MLQENAELSSSLQEDRLRVLLPNKGVETIKKRILASILELAGTTQFADWLRKETPKDDDLVIFNNSFVFRKPLVKTSKNPQYLSCRIKKGQPDLANVLVVKPGEINSDFKLFSARSGNMPAHEPLDQAVQKELKRLGRLVFVLIGELREIPTGVSVNHNRVKELKFDVPSGREAGLEHGPLGITIWVNQISDPEAAWRAIRPDLEQELGEGLTDLEEGFADAFENLQQEVRLRLILPDPEAKKDSDSFIERIRASVAEQRKLYEGALGRYKGGGNAADDHLREAMRIAYNFADDAIKVLLLLVSIGDLKPIVLWCTIKEQFDVAEAFRNLPWTKSRKKPSLDRYREIISGARSRAFHNLLAFDRTIEADLGGVDLKARRLTLLPAHGRRKTDVAFDYEDREIVEILTQLTRAPEVKVPFDFWKKNAAVMESFDKLLASTEDALWALIRAQR